MSRYTRSTAEKQLTALLDISLRTPYAGKFGAVIQEQIDAESIEIVEAMQPAELLGFLRGLRSYQWRKGLVQDMATGPIN